MKYDEKRFNNLRLRIEEAYLKSGNSLGWRLLYSPKYVLNGSKVAFIGLNPGGSKAESAHGEFGMTAGSAYLNESWDGKLPGKSRLQVQVLAMFRRLGVRPDSVLAGNLVPFRSPSWEALSNPRDSLEFGFSIWREILETASPKIVVSMGNATNEYIAHLLSVQQKKPYSVNWGNIRAWRGDFSGGTWIGLPHLSRFAIMTRQESADEIDLLLEGISIS